jgi:putative methionine-R-sulfoxide reductase with GAF domain
LIVTDVANLRAGYIACDPRDRSEAVIPLFEPGGQTCWGVLDADSFDIGAFSERDVEGMLSVLVAAGLTPPSPDRPPTEVV